MPTEIETKELEGFTIRQLGEIQTMDLDGEEEDVFGVILEGSIETVRAAAKFIGTKVQLAALESPIGEQGVGVKALTWEPVPDGVYVGEACRAESVVGTYLAQEGTAYFNDELIGEDGETMPDGKAIAQADFTRRILSALSPERKEPVREALASIPQGAIDALRNNQRQLDVDGCEVGVSRQAIDEILAGIDAALAATPGQPT